MDLHDEIVLAVTDTVLDTAMGNAGSDRMNVVLAGLDNEMERREMEEEEVNFSDIELHNVVSDILKNIEDAEKEASLSLDDDEDELRGFMSETSLLQLLEVDTDNSGDLSPDELRDIADDLEGESEFAATAAEEAEKINRQAGSSYITDQEYWEKMGISTGEDLAKSVLAQTYSDTYKSMYGTRPRLPFSEMSVEKIQSMISSLDDDWYEMRHYDDQAWKDDDPKYIARGQAIEAEYEADKVQRAEEEELERMRIPEEGEGEPKRMGMGRRPLVGPARDVRRGRKISESKNLSRSELKSFFRMIMEDAPPGDGLVSVETALQEKLVAAGVPESWVIEVVNKLQNITPLNAMQVTQLDSQSDLLSQELQIIEDKWSKSVDTNWATWKTDSVPVEVVDQIATLVKEKIVG